MCLSIFIFRAIFFLCLVFLLLLQKDHIQNGVENSTSKVMARGKSWSNKEGGECSNGDAFTGDPKNVCIRSGCASDHILIDNMQRRTVLVTPSELHASSAIIDERLPKDERTTVMEGCTVANGFKEVSSNGTETSLNLNETKESECERDENKTALQNDSEQEKIENADYFVCDGIEKDIDCKTESDVSDDQVFFFFLT